MTGSEEQRSIHVLECAMIWEAVSSGFNGLSTGVKGAIMGAGESDDLEPFCNSS